MHEKVKMFCDGRESEEKIWQIICEHRGHIFPDDWGRIAKVLNADESIAGHQWTGGKVQYFYRRMVLNSTRPESPYGKLEDSEMQEENSEENTEK